MIIYNIIYLYQRKVWSKKYHLRQYACFGSYKKKSANEKLNQMQGETTNIGVLLRWLIFKNNKEFTKRASDSQGNCLRFNTNTAERVLKGLGNGQMEMQ